MSRNTENRGFCCEHCQQMVLPVTNGSYRNHCPFCLRSSMSIFCPATGAIPVAVLWTRLGCTQGKKAIRLRLYVAVAESAT